MAIVFHQIRIPNGVDLRLNLGNDINRINRQNHRQKQRGTIWSTSLCTVYSSRLDLSKFLTQNEEKEPSLRKKDHM